MTNQRSDYLSIQFIFLGDEVRHRTLSGDMISNLGPMVDPLNHNCISVYNKRSVN